MLIAGVAVVSTVVLVMIWAYELVLVLPFKEMGPAPSMVMRPPLEEISANAPEPVPASISMPRDWIVTVLAALPTVICAKELRAVLPVRTSKLEAVALILPLVVAI